MDDMDYPSVVLQDFTQNVTDRKIATKLVRGFRYLMEEISMNQKKYWIDKDIQRASNVKNEFLRRADITGKKGMHKISSAYETLAVRNEGKIQELSGKIDKIHAETNKRLDVIIGDDKDFQALRSEMFSSVNKG